MANHREETVYLNLLSIYEHRFGKGEREAGNMGFDPLNFFKNKNQAQKDYLRLNELKNGRLAMIALAGFYCDAKIPGSVPFGGLF